MNTARHATAIELPKPLPMAARILVRWLSGLRTGRLEGILPDGQSFLIQAPARGPSGTMILHAPARMLFRTASRGALGFAESYMAGEWSSPALADLLELLGANEDHLDRRSRGTWAGRLGAALHHRRNANTRSGSRRNVSAHYDLGNDFYRLWLDETMSYSGALFEHPEQPLEDAQRNKYRALIERLDIGPGDRVLEIGCGWGGFAEAAAARNARVTGLSLSREQIDYARNRIARAGLAARVDLRLQDYRDVGGEYDHVVSIEMLEAVGEEYWPAYFDVLRRRVRPGGGIALHTITIDERRFAAYRANPDFIQRYIFPGGMLPTVPRLRALAATAGLELLTMERLGDDYARTLALWDERFREQVDAIRRAGFGRRFINMWHYYLAYCEAAFRTRRIDLYRLILRRPQ